MPGKKTAPKPKILPKVQTLRPILQLFERFWEKS